MPNLHGTPCSPSPALTAAPDDEAVRLLREIVEAYDWWQVDPVDRGSCDDEVSAARAYLTRKGSA